MAPKKKGNKKGNDDWEAELGESLAPATEQPAAAAEANGDGAEGEEEEAGGGLMAMLRKRKERRKQKGLPEEEQAETTGEPDLSHVQTAQEANADDEFALPDKKGKGGKGKQAQQKKGGAQPAADGDNDGAEPNRVLTKAEKEKLKKEREKQRKKEQVCGTPQEPRARRFGLTKFSGCKEEDNRPCEGTRDCRSGGEGRGQDTRPRGSSCARDRRQEEEAPCPPGSNSEAAGGAASQARSRGKAQG
jgi:translation initiation factor 5B